MPPMKPRQNPFGPQNSNSLSNWLKAGAAQERERRKTRASQRTKSLVEMVEELKKRPKR